MMGWIILHSPHLLQLVLCTTHLVELNAFERIVAENSTNSKRVNILINISDMTDKQQQLDEVSQLFDSAISFVKSKVTFWDPLPPPL